MDLELQKLLYKLFADLPFDFVDGVQDVAFPYGAFGYSTNIELNTKTTRGNLVSIQLDLFSNYNGQKEVKEMEEQVLNCLQSTPLLINSRPVILDSWNFQVIHESANKIYHGVLELEFKIY